MIILYQFAPVWGLPNTSPFCLKIETYLRMTEIPYEVKFVMDPRKSPKGKLPVIQLNGEKIPDSELIIDYLKVKFGDVLDKNLNQEQKALSLLLDNLFAERLYWIMLYTRWLDDNAWPYIKRDFFAKLPSIAKYIIPNAVRKQMKKTAYAQGIGRHTLDEVLQMGYKTIDAIAVILGEKKYFHGEELTSIDATAFAFLANIIWLPYNDKLKTYLSNYKNLVTFCEKMWGSFYPEIAKPFAAARS